jgi:hypothetical protein
MRIRFVAISERFVRLTVVCLMIGSVSAAVVLLAGPPASASTLKVTNCDDSGTGSLRGAVAAASPGETITFALRASCPTDANHVPTITLTTGFIELTGNVTIKGPGVTSLAVSGGTSPTAFKIDAGVSATISGLTIENTVVIPILFKCAGVKKGSQEGLGGGGVLNLGTLTLTKSAVSGNTLPCHDGGGIENDGRLTVTSSTISNNAANFGSGGGLTNYGTASLSKTTLSGNSSPAGNGGGIENYGTLTITHSSVPNNTAPIGQGGGIDNSGSVTMTTSSLTGNNDSLGGGGIYAFAGTVTLMKSTLSGNSGTGLGGVYLGGGAVSSTGCTVS